MLVQDLEIVQFFLPIYILVILTFLLTIFTYSLLIMDKLIFVKCF